MKRLEKYLREVESEPPSMTAEEVVVSITKSPHGPTFSAMHRHIVEFQLDLAYRGLREDKIVGKLNGELRNVYVMSLEDGRIEVQLFEDDEPARMVAVAAVAWSVCGRPYPIPIPRPCTILFKRIAEPQIEVERRRHYRGEYTVIRGYPDHVVSYLLRL